jgi:hypothetical protein
MLSALLTLLVLGVVGVVMVGVIFAILGLVISVTFGIVGFLLFKVAPVLLVGWVVLKLVERSRSSHRQIGRADQKWLDS